MYKSVSSKVDFIKLEHKQLDFWEKNKIFDKLRKQNSGGERWSFLDGPITANNPMGVHHAWGRTLKDVFNRYHSMLGQKLRYQNGFIGSSAPDGDMEIDGNLVEDISFSDIFHVEQDGAPVIAEVINHQNHNGITYIFDGWSDGVQSENRTITPTNHENYTAEFNGRPHQVSNFRITSGYYEPITIAWNQHQNNYCKYRIYRKVKHNGETTTQLISTLNNNVTSYTDIEYARTPGYSEDIVWYDARAFYTVESTEAIPYFQGVFGIEFRKQGKDSTQNNTETPAEYILLNYPNPFNPTTTINYSVLENSSVNISIYNIAGKLVKNLKNTELSAGYYSLVWDGTDNSGLQVSSGIYFIKSRIGTNMMTKKIMLMQ